MGTTGSLLGKYLGMTLGLLGLLLLESSWGHLGTTWGPLGGHLAPLGATRSNFGATWDNFGATWEHFGAILGALWDQKPCENVVGVIKIAIKSGKRKTLEKKHMVS